jgi:hypothetical protein
MGQSQPPLLEFAFYSDSIDNAKNTFFVKSIALS